MLTPFAALSACSQAKVHYLVLACADSLDTPYDLRREHVPLLEHMVRLGRRWAARASEADPGLCFRFGFHTVSIEPGWRFCVTSPCLPVLSPFSRCASKAMCVSATCDDSLVNAYSVQGGSCSLDFLVAEPCTFISLPGRPKSRTHDKSGSRVYDDSN